MTAPLIPIRSEALQDAIQERVKAYIIHHQLAPGTVLPTEMELAKELGVSRSALREAMKVLQTLGIVETRHGQGTFVGQFTLNALIDGLSFRILFDSTHGLATVRDLLDVRQTLECSLVARLPEVITPTYLAGLQAIVDQMAACAAQGERFAEADRAFHFELYRPLGNNLVSQLLQAFWDIFQGIQGALPGTPPDPFASVEAHERILTALAARDAAGASIAMIDHFAGIQRWINEPSTLIQFHGVKEESKNISIGPK